jgi:hypothetical protein
LKRFCRRIIDRVRNVDVRVLQTKFDELLSTVLKTECVALMSLYCRQNSKRRFPCIIDKPGASVSKYYRQDLKRWWRSCDFKFRNKLGVCAVTRLKIEKVGLCLSCFDVIIVIIHTLLLRIGTSLVTF